MKTLNTYINEWKLNNQSAKDIDKVDYSKFFVYEIDKEKNIRILCTTFWNEFYKIKDNIYINGTHIELDDKGFTIYKFKPGKYFVEIKDLETVTACNAMFNYCYDLVKVPLFDTSNITCMHYMFEDCTKLKEVPKFDVQNVIDMQFMFNRCDSLKDVPLFLNIREDCSKYNIFDGCSNLSEKTKRDWSKVYNF